MGLGRPRSWEPWEGRPVASRYDPSAKVHRVWIDEVEVARVERGPFLDASGGAVAGHALAWRWSLLASPVQGGVALTQRRAVEAIKRAHARVVSEWATAP